MFVSVSRFQWAARLAVAATLLLPAVFAPPALAQPDKPNDPVREYAYGPAQGLPDTGVGTVTQALYDDAEKDGWMIISMKNDWKRIFSFE